jgi:hypothetical protein
MHGIHGFSDNYVLCFNFMFIVFSLLQFRFRPLVTYHHSNTNHINATTVTKFIAISVLCGGMNVTSAANRLCSSVQFAVTGQNRNAI